MNKKQILGVWWWLWLAVGLVAITGLVAGSFCDWQVSSAVVHQSAFNTFFEKCGCMFSFAMLVVAGVCLFKALKGLKRSFWAWVLLFAGSAGPLVKYHDFLVGYVATGFVVLDYFVSIVCAMLFYGIVLLLAFKLIDGSDTKKLVVVGTTIFVGCLLVLGLSTLLKILASRPRYRFLTSAENTGEQFVSWWQWLPGKSLTMGENFKSFPSGHVANSAIILTLPLLAGVVKKKCPPTILFLIGLLFVLFMAYNRLATGAHFLSDVSFALAEALTVYVVVGQIVQKTVSKICANTNTCVG